MADVELAGIGAWSESFSSWEQFCALANGEAATESSAPQPELIPARERRRAPLFVRMALDVMEQACRMASIDRASVATVFASGMGDMQTTDYMCATLATQPRTISPTKFHNSVHNASTGYWSIATGSHAPANAVSGYAHSGALALLESAVQVAEEHTPVLLAVQEMAPPTPFRSVYQGRQPLAVSLLLAPHGTIESPIGNLSMRLVHGERLPDPASVVADERWEGNFAAALIALLFSVSSGKEATWTLPVSPSSGLAVSFRPGAATSPANG